MVIGGLAAELYRFSTGASRRAAKPLSLQVLSSNPDILYVRFSAKGRRTEREC